jgi:hypothetical protein
VTAPRRGAGGPSNRLTSGEDGDDTDCAQAPTAFSRPILCSATHRRCYRCRLQTWQRRLMPLSFSTCLGGSETQTRG